jgi:sodium-dependent dicarboxylate transporter 2/3/5
VIFLTELSSNTATAALLVPIFFAVTVEMNLPPKQLVIPLTIAASCAFMLPVATPPNAIVFGTGRVTQRTMIRVGFVMNVVFIVVLTILSRFLV